MPQIYFGFNNETKPFVDTLDEWNKLIKKDILPLKNESKLSNIINLIFRFPSLIKCYEFIYQNIFLIQGESNDKVDCGRCMAPSLPTSETSPNRWHHL